MKIKSDLLFKSFLISLIIFALIASAVIINLYQNRIAVDPERRESNLLIGLTHNGEILSMQLVHCDPKHDSFVFLSIPDNTMLENGNVLQSQYRSTNAQEVVDSIEDITGARVNRYIFIPLDNLVQLIDDVGKFEYLIRYPFVYNGIEYSGNTYMTGELAKAMFLYGSYDMSKTSMSLIGESLLHNFLSSHSNADGMNALKNAVSLRSVNTNLSSEDISEYCNFFLRFSELDHQTVEIEGKTMASSSSLYFIPSQYKATKNIFK